MSDVTTQSAEGRRHEPVPLSPSRAPLVPPGLGAYLDADHAELRRRVFALLATPEFARPEAEPADYRGQVYEWLHALARHGLGGLAFPAEHGGRGDTTAAIAVFETLAHHDLSLLVKFGVHFGLFGGSIYLLGSERHHARYLRPVAALELPGCFAMTETDHGSNVRDLETTATYDADAGEFVIHTPHAGARKDYIGNAALHARLAVVFAQLRVEGEPRGVHALLVPLRDERGRPLPGVRIEDCGAKAGLNGVDNGRLYFERVRVPRENLLDRFAQVSESGAYTSDIESGNRRFFTMLSALVAGRISIAAASVSAGKCALTIALEYTAGRRQFGPEGEPEVPVLDYPVLHRRLLGRLATTYALHFAVRDLVRRFGGAEAGQDPELEALAAGVKAYASAHAVATARACREACGGRGYLAASRIAAIAADTDVFTTFEGANDVLLQLVARALLTDYREQFEDLRGTLRYIGGRAVAALTEWNPVSTRRTDETHLLDPDFHRAAFAFRQQSLVDTLARRLKARLDRGMEPFAAWNECQPHALAAARAAVELHLLERFLEAVEGCPEEAGREVLAELAALFAADRLDRDRAWFLESGFFEPPKSKAVRNLAQTLSGTLRPRARDLVRAFGIPAAVLAAPGLVETGT